ncbi:aldo/keto reductase [Rhizobium sp. TRM96647]|uniref:Aryl-alcohol dehydrogenase-like predicted oxidoreductase n=1 Tax=Mycoplana azooxidifex TaxID=1636188 RepID=A0A7W6GNF8_9HYPH|nr:MULTISPECIES: aldo/keto reductase [Rhizobiaceae]MBB3979939.1 aryl-alcohol dehydrogenase-like predicted oxidoreductase [Mycoplana azooxidifex]MCV3738922.1 aldo/keto reductase [Rhizobium sp. TRM96647]MCV3760679.1 aldo/keto reductase [Rhizobium sp. TRM96650]
MSEQQDSGFSRRAFIGALGTGATIAATTPFFSAEAQAQAGGPATASMTHARTRTIPRTEQTLTTLGLGTFLTFDTRPGDDRRNLGEVFRRYVAGGGRVIDTSPLYGSAEVSVGAFLAGTPEASEIFVANKIWSTGKYLGDESHAVASFEQSRLRIWRDTIDLMQCHSIVNAPVVIPLMQAWKKEGRIRHVGVTHHEAGAQDQLAELVERGGVDFIQTNYSIFDRSAERRLLPAAAARGIGVLINLPLEKARLMKVVEGRSLPDFAREFEAATWAQFFLKWVMAHPAVTTVLCGTSNPEHAEDNVQAMYGPLPDEAMRRRMVQHMETIPGFADIGRMPWYPGKDAQYQGLIRAAQATARARIGH